MIWTPLTVALLANLGLAAATNQTGDSALERTLSAEISASRSGTFDGVFGKWESRYGPKAVTPLLRIASNRKLDDSKRYLALMGAARLGGLGAAPLLASFLKDRSWMLRSGALRALAALGDPSTGQKILPLLRDPALVVRAEAVDSISRLRPVGAAEALVDAIQDQSNYRGGKALWVPRRALEALVAIGARECVPKLGRLLDHSGDPELLESTLRALESLTGRSLKTGEPLASRVAAWRDVLKAP